MKQSLRIWQMFDIQEVGQHLLILGDVVGDCANCRELGIDPWKATECPRCRTPFQFIASRRLATHPGERFQLARRILEQRPSLQMIDYEDYQKTLGSQKAKEFFRS